MQPEKTSQPSSLALQLAGHAVMGVALGLSFCFALMLVEPTTVAALVSHANEPKTTAVMLLSFFALLFGTGATLTGIIFATMESAERSDER